MTDIPAALDPSERLLYGSDIDADLGISDRGRRKMVADGRLPQPAGYIGGRAVWRRAELARDQVAAAKKHLRSLASEVPQS